MLCSVPSAYVLSVLLVERLIKIYVRSFLLLKQFGRDASAFFSRYFEESTEVDRLNDPDWVDISID